MRHDYWKSQLYPIPWYSNKTGVAVVGVFRRYAPVPYDWPQVNAVEFAVRGRLGTAGYRGVEALLHAPAWLDGWRFRAEAEVLREARLDYYGLGNDVRRDEGRVTDSTEHFYRVRRTLARVGADVQRRITGPVRILVGASYRRSAFVPLPGGTQFSEDVAAGRVRATDLTTEAAVGRAGLIVDTRDGELDPRRGVAAEVMAAGDGTFTRLTAHLRGFLPAGPRLRLAARLAAERMGGSPPFGERFFLEAAEGAVPAVGGYHSHRGVDELRYVGAGKLLGSLDARYGAVAVPSIGELTLFGFVDAGRVFGVSSFALTTTDLHWGGGGGAALKLGRNTLFAVTLAAGPDGVTGHFGSGWSY